MRSGYQALVPLFKHQQSDTEPGLAGTSPRPPGEPFPPTTATVADPGAAAEPRPVTEPAPVPSESAAPLVVPKTRTSATYSGVAVGLVVLLLVIIFIAQNLNDAKVHFLGLAFLLPLGLLILASAVAGGLIVLLVSAARLAQLRLMARRHQAGKPTR